MSVTQRLLRGRVRGCRESMRASASLADLVTDAVRSVTARWRPGRARSRAVKHRRTQARPRRPGCRPTGAPNASGMRKPPRAPTAPATPSAAEACLVAGRARPPLGGVRPVVARSAACARSPGSSCRPIRCRCRWRRRCRGRRRGTTGTEACSRSRSPGPRSGSASAAASVQITARVKTIIVSERTEGDPGPAVLVRQPAAERPGGRADARPRGRRSRRRRCRCRAARARAPRSRA